MRRNRRRSSSYRTDRRLLFGAVGLVALLAVTVNCSFENNFAAGASETGNSDPLVTASLNLEEPQLMPEEKAEPAENKSAVLSGDLWADALDTVDHPRPAHTPPDRISLNVQDADLLDVLSMLAYKLDANIIYLEEPRTITIKTSVLSPLTTLQIVLQKEGLDYLTLGRNYIVGERGRLYEDFTNRMFLCRYDLFYVSASDMESYIEELGMPVQSLSVDSNQKAIWMQGTPMTLGKARELINTLDVMDNAAFAEGGARKIRMPVAVATGDRAEEELEALIDLLSILLDGFRDGRTDMGWVTWDHPDPVPSIFMDWKSPIIKPYDIKMKVTRDFANNYNAQIRYLIAEGNPDNIELVNQMISAISGTPSTPISLTEILEPDPEPDNNNNNNNNNDNNGGNNNTVEWLPAAPQGSNVQEYNVSVNGVPSHGGALAGSGLYSVGTTVTVTATPAEGYRFVRWIENGSEVSTSKSYSFSVYGNRSLEAVFSSMPADTEDVSEDDDPA